MNIKILILLFLVSCSQLPIGERFDQFLEDTFNKQIERSPEFQAYVGLETNKNTWDDTSIFYEMDDFYITKQSLKKLFSFNKAELSDSQKISYDLMRWQLEKNIESEKFYYHKYFISHFSGDHSYIPTFLMNKHKIQNIEDANNYIKRVIKIEPRIAYLSKKIILASEKNIYLPKWSYPKIIKTFKNLIVKDTDSLFYKDFLRKITELKISKEEEKNLLYELSVALNDYAFPSFERIIKSLEELYEKAPKHDGVWKMPNGLEYYQSLLNYYTTTKLSYDQIHKIGLENVTRIHNEMKEIMKKVKFKGSLKKFFIFMREDKKFYYENNDKGREKYLKDSWEIVHRMQAKLPEYFSLLPKSPLEIRRVEIFREASAAKAFYQSGTPDGKRPGIFYANLKDMMAIPKYSNEALIYHEAIPGHHMQISIAHELEGIPSFQKYSGFTAYTEGWGLYSEWLPTQMGKEFYKDPYSDFGRLNMELMRAMRLVVDTGIHAYKWTGEEAIKYFMDNSPIGEVESTGQIERYIVYPGQATSYLIGKLKIQELYLKCQESSKIKGQVFDVKKFHYEVLKNGPMPLDLLEKNINKNFGLE